MDNAFIQGVVPLLSTQEKIVPRRTGPRSMGAHISVCTEQEMKRLGLPLVQELGKGFSFKVLEIHRFTVVGKKLWALTVDAPSLSLLRESYGLKPTLQNHAFHITLGKEIALDDVLSLNDDEEAA